MNMSYVGLVPELVETAAQDLAGIRTGLLEVTSAAAGATTQLSPAAADEVSTAIAQLFGNFGRDYQATMARAAVFHDEFVSLVSRSASAYLATEVTNGAALLRVGHSFAAAAENAAAFGAGLGGQVGGSLTGSFDAAPLLRALSALPNLGAGLALQAGGALASGFGTGLVQTGQAIVSAGVAFENLGAAMSGTGAALTGEANAALLAFFNSEFAANLSATLTANLSVQLPALSELAQSGGILIGNLFAGLFQLASTSGAFAANFGASLAAVVAAGQGLVANLGVALPAVAG
ncbi:PE domain-containing protein, partial [Mycobacterium decipiens]